MYKTKRELYERCKACGIKNISKMNKKELEDALIIYDSVNFFNSIVGNTITIVDGTVDISNN
jgi:hypothetical protein